MIPAPIHGRRRWPVAILVASLLAGCSFGSTKTVTLYSPQLHVEAKPEWPAANWSLVVAKPLASDALDSVRIAVRVQPSTLQVYQGAVWSDPAPDLVQSALVQAFEDSGKLASVGRPSSGIHGDVFLVMELRRFESVYDQPKQPPKVVIELQAKLLGGPGGKVMATRTFHAEAAASSEKVPAVVAAFEAAMSQSTAEVVGWTLTTGQANAPGAPSGHK